MTGFKITSLEPDLRSLERGLCAMGLELHEESFEDGSDLGLEDGSDLGLEDEFEDNEPDDLDDIDFDLFRKSESF